MSDHINYIDPDDPELDEHEVTTSLNEIAKAAFENSAAHGFWDDRPVDGSELLSYLGNKIALIHSEASEALEELRGPKGALNVYHSYKPVPASFAVEFASGADATEAWQKTQTPKPEGIGSELADIIIRVGDLAHFLGIDLEAVVAEKMAYNAGREHMHGKAF